MSWKYAVVASPDGGLKYMRKENHQYNSTNFAVSGKSIHMYKLYT